MKELKLVWFYSLKQKTEDLPKEIWVRPPSGCHCPYLPYLNMKLKFTIQGLSLANVEFPGNLYVVLSPYNLLHSSLLYFSVCRRYDNVQSIQSCLPLKDLMEDSLWVILTPDHISFQQSDLFLSCWNFDHVTENTPFFVCY